MSIASGSTLFHPPPPPHQNQLPPGIITLPIPLVPHCVNSSRIGSFILLLLLTRINFLQVSQFPYPWNHTVSIASKSTLFHPPPPPHQNQLPSGITVPIPLEPHCVNSSRIHTLSYSSSSSPESTSFRYHSSLTSGTTLCQ